MSAIYLPIADGRELPVDPRFVLLSGLDADGNPVALKLSAAGGVAGAATEVTLSGLKRRSFAEGGCEFLSSADGELSGKNYYGFVVITDTVLSAITLGAGATGGARLVGPTLPAGLLLMVPITGITIASGIVQALKS